MDSHIDRGATGYFYSIKMSRVGLSMYLSIWIVIIRLLSRIPLVAAPAPCPRYPDSTCKGPYVIRPALKTSPDARPQCQADQWAVMTSCMQRCQQDACCRAFGLDAAGDCVTSNITTEDLHFVKESEDPLQAECIQGLSSNKFELNLR